MSIKSDLKKDGIEVTEKLDTLKINSIAMNISKKICDTFPEYGLNQNDLFIRLSRLNMYKAKMPKGIGPGCFGKEERRFHCRQDERHRRAAVHRLLCQD